MPLPREVARGLRKTATRIGKVRVAAVADAATAGVEEAQRAGGAFQFGAARRATRMHASVTHTANKATTSTARIVGVPVGAWVMKTSGRRGGYDVRGTRRPLGIGGSPVAAWGAHISTGTRGDGRWTRVVDAITGELDRAVDHYLTEALEAS